MRGFDRDINAGIFGGIPHRVLNEVVHRDPKQFGVCINLTVGVGIRVDGDVLGFGGEIGTINSLPHQAVD